jgi:hypothetical protein
MQTIVKSIQFPFLIGIKIPDTLLLQIDFFFLQ